MATIDDSYVLEIEHIRQREIEKVRNKGVEISNNTQLKDIPNKIDQINSPTSILDKSITSIESMSAIVLESFAFLNCSNLTKAYFPNAVEIGQSTFNNTTSLSNKNGYFKEVVTCNPFSFNNSGFENIVLEKFNGDFGVSAGQSYFIRGSFNIKRLVTPLARNTGSSNFLNGVGNIELIDIQANVISTSTTKSTMTTLILRGNSLSSATNDISSTLANATIYVPEDLLNTYKTATNWSTIANQIVKLEGTKYESPTWYLTEDWFLNMYHYTSVLDEEPSNE